MMKSMKFFILVSITLFAYANAEADSNETSVLNYADPTNKSQWSSSICSVKTQLGDRIGTAFFIGLKTLMTTASILYGMYPNENFIVCASPLLNGLTLKIEKYTIHPEFLSNNNDNDIALIHVQEAGDEKVLDTKNILIFKLPKPYQIKPLMPATILKWVAKKEVNLVSLKAENVVIERPIDIFLKSRRCIDEADVCVRPGEWDLGLLNMGSPLVMEIDGEVAVQALYTRRPHSLNQKVTCFLKVAPYVSWIESVMAKN